MRIPLIFATMLIFILFPSAASGQIIDDVAALGTPLDSITNIYTRYLSWYASDIWSPDGQWLAFANWGCCVDLVQYSNGSQMQVYEYDQITEEYQDVIEEYEIVRYNNINSIHDLLFTPDSRQVTIVQDYIDEQKGSQVSVVWNEQLSPAQYEFVVTNPVPRILSVNIETGETIYHADGYCPSWSNDGRYLAFIAYDYREFVDGLTPEHHRELAVYDTITEQTIHTGLILDPEKTYPIITPDGQYVYYNVYEKYAAYDEDHMIGRSWIYRVTVNGGTPEEIVSQENCLITFGRPIHRPDISPDGNWLVFDRETIYQEESAASPGEYNYQNISRLSVLNLQSVEFFDVFDPEKLHQVKLQTPQFSSDGSQLCFFGMNYEMTGDFQFSRDRNSENFYVAALDPDNLYPISSTPTAVNDEAPESFMTVQNFPNPFNPTTTISFTIPEAGFSEVAIYNITGQKVRTLVTGLLAAGTHQFVWDGCDDRNNPVSSGVFVSQLSSGGNVVTNRMTLVR